MSLSGRIDDLPSFDGADGVDRLHVATEDANTETGEEEYFLFTGKVGVMRSTNVHLIIRMLMKLDTADF